MTKLFTSYYRLAKKELRAAKKRGDKREVDRIMDEAEAVVDALIAAMPPDPRR